MLGASLYLIVFRTVHIAAAIAWGGSVFFVVVFVQPTAKAIGPAAGPFIRELLGTRKLIDRLIAAAWVTVIAGAFLYWHDWQGFGSLGDMLGTAFGLWLTIGAIWALIALAVGMFATRPVILRTLALGGQIAQAGDAPPPQLMQELAATQARARTLARLNLAFIVIAAFAMSTARYW
jgi:uncharacterized membrane protein